MGNIGGIPSEYPYEDVLDVGLYKFKINKINKINKQLYASIPGVSFRVSTMHERHSLTDASQ